MARGRKQELDVAPLKSARRQDHFNLSRHGGPRHASGAVTASTSPRPFRGSINQHVLFLTDTITLEPIAVHNNCGIIVVWILLWEIKMRLFVGFLVLVALMGLASGFSPVETTAMKKLAPEHRPLAAPLYAKFSKAQRKKLGMDEFDDEYDLGMALDNNTDPLITKIIAGSFIVSMLAALIFGIVIPATADYGEGVCNTLLTAGRC